MSQLTELIQISEGLLKLSMMTMIGLYFIFSNTVMKSLKNMENGADVMVEINQVILNPVFMAFFILSGVASAYFTFTGEGMLRVSGGIFFIGTTLVTIIKNVPLNNELEDTIAPNSRAVFWQEYLQKWVFWNHLRTVSGITSGFFILV